MNDNIKAWIERRKFEREIECAQRSIQYHTGQLEVYRNQNNWHMIRYCKRKIKEARADLNYYQAQLDKVAA